MRSIHIRWYCSLLLLLLAGCSATAPRAVKNVTSYEESVSQVKNILLIIYDNDGGPASYRRFEEFMTATLASRAVAIQYFYYQAKDTMAEQKIKALAVQHQFDFIIKQSTRENIPLNQGNNGRLGNGISPWGTMGQVGTASMNFMGYRKKDIYRLVWKCSCDEMDTNIFQRIPSAAATCLVSSMIQQGLVPANPVK